MIGVFDSGFGGLTILKHFLSDLEDYDYLYLGDNARAPYGSKSQEVIYNYTKEVVDFLFGQGCKLIIVACNSVSSQALRKIQQEYLVEKYPDRKILGVVIPMAEEVAKNRNIKKVGVIGTKATIASGVYEKEIHKLNHDIDIIQKATPLLVPLIEEGWLKKPETKMILKKYLRSFKNNKIDYLILGCTHYLILIKDIKKNMGKNCQIDDPGEIVSRSLADYLERHNELGLEKSKEKKRLFFTTDDEEKFKQLGEEFLGEGMKDIIRVEL